MAPPAGWLQETPTKTRSSAGSGGAPRRARQRSGRLDPPLTRKAWRAAGGYSGRAARPRRVDATSPQPQPLNQINMMFSSARGWPSLYQTMTFRSELTTPVACQSSACSV